MLIALVGTELLYVLVVNAALNFGGVQKALSSTDDVRVTFDHAWTLWPGTVHAKNLRMLFHDHNLEWSLDVATFEVDVKFLPFAHKTLHATRVRGEGAVFYMRHRVAPADATLASTRALAPIPEFETPAVFPAYVPAAPRTDLWRIHLEDVDVGVTELWAQQLRYIGSGRARGAFRLHAGHHLWVGPATLDLEPGQLIADRRTLMGKIRGHIDCIVHPFFVNEPVGLEVLRYVSARLDLHGEDVRLEPLDLFLPAGVALHTPDSRLDMSVATDRGVITPESHFELRGPELRVRQNEWSLDAHGYDVGGTTAGDGLGELSLLLEHANGARSGNVKTRVRLERGKFAAATSTLDTTGDWKLVRVDGAVSRLELPELAGFDALVKSTGLRLTAGSARVDGSGRYAAGAVSGEGRAVVSRARGRMKSIGWELDGNANASIGRAETERTGAERTSLVVDAKQAALISGHTRVDATEARFTGRTHTVRGRTTGSLSGKIRNLEFHSGQALRGRSRNSELKSELEYSKSVLSRAWVEMKLPSLSMRAGDTSVSADAQFFGEARDLDVTRKRGLVSSSLVVRDVTIVDAADGEKCQRVTVPRATIRSKLGFTERGIPRLDIDADIDSAKGRWDDLEITTSARVTSTILQEESQRVTLDVDATRFHVTSGTSPKQGWEAKIPKLRIVSNLRSGAGQFSGSVAMRAKAMEGRIGRTPVHGDVAADWKLSLLDLARGEAIGSGEVRIDKAGLEAGDLRVADWWGRVQLPLLSVTGGRNLGVLGRFRAKFRDGLPALGMFAASGDLPGWVPTILPLHELEAKGDFQRSCRTTDIYIREASGGPLAAAGRVQSVPDDTRGAFLLQLRSPIVVSTGLVNYGDNVGVAIFAGDDWLAEQSTTLDQWALVATCKPAAESCSR